MKKQQIVIAEISKPQGIKGEVKLSIFLDNAELFCRLDKVLLKGQWIKVLSARVAGNEVVARLEGVDDRNAAETLRGEQLFIDRSVADEIKTGDYFIDDMLGLSVFVGLDNAGSIVDVYQYGAADVLVIDGEEKRFMVPYITRLVTSVDLAAGRINMDEKVFNEVVVYED